MYFINPESFTQIGSAISEIIDFEKLDLPAPWNPSALIIPNGRDALVSCCFSGHILLVHIEEDPH